MRNRDVNDCTKTRNNTMVLGDQVGGGGGVCGGGVGGGVMGGGGGGWGGEGGGGAYLIAGKSGKPILQH